jgi:hypothetical protein
MAVPPAAMTVRIKIRAAMRAPGLTVLALTPAIIAGLRGGVRFRRDVAGMAVMVTAGRRVGRRRCRRAGNEPLRFALTHLRTYFDDEPAAIEGADWCAARRAPGRASQG